MRRGHERVPRASHVHGWRLRRIGSREQRRDVRCRDERVPRGVDLLERNVRRGRRAQGRDGVEHEQGALDLLRRRPGRGHDELELRGLRLDLQVWSNMLVHRWLLPVHGLHGRQPMRLGLLLPRPESESLLAEQLRRRLPGERVHGRVALHDRNRVRDGHRLLHVLTGAYRLRVRGAQKGRPCMRVSARARSVPHESGPRSSRSSGSSWRSKQLHA